MRSRAALFVLLLALPAFADRYGSVVVAPAPAFGSPEIGSYYEYRFYVANESREPHVLQLELYNDKIDSPGPKLTARTRRAFHLAARSIAIISVPQLITTGATASEATVEIDGRREKRPLVLKQESTWDYGRELRIFASRSVPADAMPNTSLTRTELPPSQWSTSWLQYARFEAVLVTAADWAELPPPVRAALLDWTAAGGWLHFIGIPDGLPALRRSSTAQLPYLFHGTGRVSVAPEDRPMSAALQDALIESGKHRLHDDPVLYAERQLPLLDDNRLPMRSLFGVLLAFAVIGGPINFYTLAKKNRRVWVFVSIPLLSIFTSILLVGATIMDEGWMRRERSRSLTLLDESTGSAVTFGLRGIYATMAPRGEVRFDAMTELRAGPTVAEAETEWNDGQRLSGSWVGTRVPTYFAMRKVERRRERLPLRVENGALVAVNGLGSPVKRLWVAGTDGTLFTATNIAPGSRVVLGRSTDRPRVDDVALDPAERLLKVSAWHSIASMAEEDPSSLLQPGMYLAVLEKSPFLEPALERASESQSPGVVLAWIRSGGADAR